MEAWKHRWYDGAHCGSSGSGSNRIATMNEIIEDEAKKKGVQLWTNRPDTR